MTTDGFRELMRKAQVGDRAARDELFALAVPLVERWVHRSPCPVRPGESLNEIAQEAARRLLIKLDQFDGARDAPDDATARALFSGWVRQIAHRVRMNLVRANKKPPGKQVPLRQAGGDSTSLDGAIDPTAPEPTPSANVRADERARLVLAALESLPDPINREIMRLRFFEEQSLRQIAEQLHLTYDIVRERFRMTKKRLERELEGLQ